LVLIDSNSIFYSERETHDLVLDHDFSHIQTKAAYHLTHRNYNVFINFESSSFIAE
jgi:hypothetical protein